MIFSMLVIWARDHMFIVCFLCVCRTESVAEKMLTNWFTFLLYKFLKVADVFVFRHPKHFYYSCYCFIVLEVSSQICCKGLKTVLKRFIHFNSESSLFFNIMGFQSNISQISSLSGLSELCWPYGAERLHSSSSLSNPLSRSAQVNHSFPSSVPSSSRWKKAPLTPSQERRATHSVRTSSSGNRLTTRRW